MGHIHVFDLFSVSSVMLIFSWFVVVSQALTTGTIGQRKQIIGHRKMTPHVGTGNDKTFDAQSTKSDDYSGYTVMCNDHGESHKLPVGIYTEEEAQLQIGKRLRAFCNFA